MSIDLDTNRNSVLQAFNDVVSDKKATDWALFGYEGQSNVLKVVGTGEDGLEELAEDLNSSKIMYAAVRVIDPNTTRPKIILINWVCIAINLPVLLAITVMFLIRPLGCWPDYSDSWCLQSSVPHRHNS
nr:drebrin-like protein [Cherax quadricarinatus]